jgi:hypothetical protein
MGTMVKCHAADDSDNHLNVGWVYEVASDDAYEYELVGIPGSWAHDRFTVVKGTRMKVKCIDSGGARSSLWAGQVYEVAHDSGEEYQLVGVAGGWMHSRFQLVQDTVCAIPTPTSEDREELEEQRLRTLLKPTVAADECCAGACKKAVCWIHKDT